MIFVQPGGKFCRILKASGEQQVLLRVEEGEEGKPVVVSTASFLVDGKATIVSVVNADIDPGTAMGLSGSPSLLLDYANAVLGDIEAELLRSLAVSDNVTLKGKAYGQLVEVDGEEGGHTHGPDCHHEDWAAPDHDDSATD